MFRLDHPSLLHSRFCVVTQRCSPRDDPRNGCVADTDVIFAVRLALRKTANEGDGGVFPEIWTMWHAIRGPKHVISSTLFSDLTQTREQTTAYTASSQFPSTRGGGLDWLQQCALQQIMSVTERPFPLSPQSPFPFLFQVPHPFLRL